MDRENFILEIMDIARNNEVFSDEELKNNICIELNKYDEHREKEIERYYNNQESEKPKINIFYDEIKIL